MVTSLAGLDDDQRLHYKSRDEQVKLLQQVLAATDADVDEQDRLLGEAKGSHRRQAGSMASMSGADDNIYIESSRRNAAKHPLFKKFRKT